MSCSQWEEKIYRYFDEMLSEEESRVLLTHIQQCESCANLYSEIKAVNDLLKEEAALAAPPEGFSSRVMAALPDAPWQINQEKTQTVVPFEKKSKTKKSFARWGTAVAAAALVAAVGVGQLPGETGPAPFIPQQGGLSVANLLPQIGEQLPIAALDDLQPVVGENPNSSNEQPAKQTIAPPTAPTPEPKVVQPREVNELPAGRTVSGSGEVVLPQVAAGKEKAGIFSLLMLAACEDADVLNPRVLDGNTVEYFIRSEDGTSKWQSKISTTEAPSLVEERTKLGAAQGLNTVTKAEWLTDSSYTEAVSPLGDMTLLNSMSEDGGLWKIVNSEENAPKLLHQASGGNILSWSPDGTKAVYTDRDGKLYAVYPTEEVVMLVFDGKVSSVSWGRDSKMIAFSATTSSSIYSAVYSADLP